MAIEATAIRDLLKARPFVPFVVNTTRIGAFRIEAPEHVLLTRSTLYVGNEVGLDGIPVDVSLIAVAQIASIGQVIE